eukprot:120964_1
MALIAQTFTEFFVQLDAQSDLTMVDVLDTLSKIENISAKLTNIVSASSWYGHEQMSAMLKECADKPWWTSFLNASWLQFIESLRLHPSETEFETHCREGFQNVMAVESLLNVNEIETTFLVQKAVERGCHILLYTQRRETINISLKR